MSLGPSSAGFRRISIVCSARRRQPPRIPARGCRRWTFTRKRNQFLLHVDLPGVDPKAVEITSEQGCLTIRGRREESRRETQQGYRRVERITGEFLRRFSLPESADVQNIKAKSQQRRAGDRNSEDCPSRAAANRGASGLRDVGRSARLTCKIAGRWDHGSSVDPGPDDVRPRSAAPSARRHVSPGSASTESQEDRA